MKPASRHLRGLLAAPLLLAPLALYAQMPAATPTPALAPPWPPGAPVSRPTPVSRTAESAVTPVNRNPRRHAEFLKRAQQPVGLLFVGDSITDFWPGRSKDTWAKFAPYEPANFGVSGERTEDVLWRLENGELDGISPRVTVVMIGTNNLGQTGDKPAWVVAGVRKIVETIHARLPDTKVLLLAIFPRDKPNSRVRPLIQAINDDLAKLEDHGKTRFLNINQVFLNSQGEIPRDIMDDGLHPSAKGYELWYEAMKPLLDEMLKS